MKLFENVKRSRAEMKTVSLFISKYENAIENYQSHSYHNALREFIESINIIVPISDIIPKCKVSYYIMKSKFKCGFYSESIAEIEELIQLITKIDPSSSLYIKLKIKTFLYKILSNIVLNNNNESVMNTIETIDFIKLKEFSLETKASMFWIFIKGFLGEGKLNKTRQFAQFKEYYDELNQHIDTGEVNKIIKTVYKTLMSTKNRKVLFDTFNHLFYLHKYNEPISNKIIQFLLINIPGHVRSESMNRLKVNFENYIRYNKIDLSVTWGNLSMMDLVNEARIRLVSFDTLYSNLCGGFDVIFSEYYVSSQDKKKEYVNALDSPRLLINDMSIINTNRKRSINEASLAIGDPNTTNLKQFPIFDYMSRTNALHKDKSLPSFHLNASYQIKNSIRKSQDSSFPFLLFQKYH